MHIKHGLTNQSMKTARCDRCDSPLRFSTYKDELVFYSRNKMLSKGFYCVKCTQSLKKVTMDDLDKFISQSRIYKFMESVLV